MYRMLPLLVVTTVACRGGSASLYEGCETGPLSTWRDNDVPATIAEAFAAEREQLGAPGVAYAILVDGEIRYAGAVGKRYRGGLRAMRPDTVLRGGSTLKMQTAALLMALEGDGTLDRSDSVATWLPELRPTADPDLLQRVTLRDLLTHQGGFADFTPIDGPAGEGSLSDFAHDVWATETRQLVEPGTFYNYSNPNYALAGLVAEVAGGAPYTEQMQERVWGPLCMKRTWFSADAVEEDGDWAAGRTLSDGELIRIEPDSYDHGFARPAGFAWTTAPDLLRFAHLLLEGEPGVMPRAQSSAIGSAQVDTHLYPEGLASYGFGIEVFERYTGLEGWREGPFLQHGGDIPGYAADLFVHPPSGVAVAVLANGDGAHFTASALHAIEVLGAPAEVEPASDGLPAEPARFVGTWVDPDDVGELRLAVDDDGLLLEAPDLDAAGIPYTARPTALTGSTYALEVDGIPQAATFIEDDQGALRWLRTRSFVAERVD